MSERKKVVIVGGGQAGYVTASKLDKHHHVTVIERKIAYHDNISALRATVDATFRWQQFQPYTSLLKAKDNKVVHGEVVAVEGAEVRLKDGQLVAFDFLVIATGAQNPFPAKMESLDSVKAGISKYEEVEGAIERASNILIVGGGPVGVELAGEIKSAYASKNVTVIHRGKSLLSNQGGAPPLLPAFTSGLTDLLSQLKVNVILEDSLQTLGSGFEEGSKTLTTVKGKEIQTDLVFWCTGNKPNTDAFKSAFAPSIDEHGLFKVNPQLQVEGHPNVFAIGDITNIPEPKLAYVAGLHAVVAAKNIAALAAQKPLAATHKPFRNTCFMIVGPHKGISQVGFLPGFMGGVHKKGMFATIKNSQRLFIDKHWKDLTGKPAPKTNPQLE